MCLQWGTKFAKAVKGEKIDERKKIEKKISEPIYPKNGKTRKWKCSVCGEIIVAVLPPPICPACAADGDIWIDVGVVDEKIEKTIFDGTIAVIGGGGAGVSAVKAIRERNDKSKVLLFSEDGLPYFR